MESSRHLSKPPRSVFLWLWAVYSMIFAIVVLGGITRLTGSGLSMVEWQPLMGTLPPLGEADWQEVFAKYKQTPQYLLVNDWMTLTDFKRIFFWEYLHRLFGRSIGVVFIIPWLVLLARGHLRGKLATRSIIAFVLGGLQGALGWFMVKSGLVDVPAVSHYRLAAHLNLAFFVGCWILWIIFDLLEASDDSGAARSDTQQAPRWVGRAAVVLLGLIAVQNVFGAFMAGKHAGQLYSSFPSMGGSYFPEAAFAAEPFWLNFFENVAGIHWIHRMLGYLIALSVIGFSAAALSRVRTTKQRWAAKLMGLGALLQASIGVLTVVWGVPISLAVIHQACGFALTSVALFAVHTYRAKATAQQPEHPQAVTPAVVQAAGGNG